MAIPFEAIAALGIGGVLWAFKWLVGREFKRFEEILDKHDRAIEVLQASDQSQQFDLTQIARLEAAQQQSQRELAEAAKQLVQLPRLHLAVEKLQKANGILTERVQRLDNVGLALRQTQELLQANQKDLLTLKGEIAGHYVPEDKYVRELTVLTSRIDAVWERIDSALGRPTPRLPEGGHRDY